MPNILRLNKLGKAADKVFPKEYVLMDACEKPDGIIVRSFKMNDKDKPFTLPESVVCVARAGAGVDNIPVAEYADKGVIVFNTPGANANAVKELVICSLFLCGRKIVDGINWAGTLKDGETPVKAQVETGKGQFVGGEILGKTIGIIGLGAIGFMTAEAAMALGMKVYGFDPGISAEKLAKLKGIKMATMDEIYAECDFITLHVPANDATKGMINKDTLAKCKQGVNIINAARGELVKNADMIEAVKSGKVNRYVIDFPVGELLNIPGIITIPHLGASTPEAEDNCVEMAGIQLIDFIENGNVINSVNFPAVKLARGNGKRCTVAYKGDLDIKKELEKTGCKVSSFACGKKGDYGYAIADCECNCSCGNIKGLSGVLRVRCF